MESAGSDEDDHSEGAVTCPDCGKPMWGVEYRGTPDDYDGVSEWACEDGCRLRVGRWTGKRLAEDEREPRYGVPRRTEA